MLHLMCINFLISSQRLLVNHSDTVELPLCEPAPPCCRGNRGIDWRFTITAVKNPKRSAERRVSLYDLYKKKMKKEEVEQGKAFIVDFCDRRRGGV